MEFTKTVKRERVRLVGFEAVSFGTIGAETIYETWKFCINGRLYFLRLNKWSRGNSASVDNFYQRGICTDACIHENIAIPEYVLDAFYAIRAYHPIFKSKKMLVSEWDIARHNRIVRKLSK